MAHPETMKAAVISGPGEIRIVSKPVPEPGRAEVLVKVEYCGICGSDIHAYETGFFPPGLTFGHEFSGRVAGTGNEAGLWAVGERVAGNNNTPCGACPPCLAGKDNLCQQMRRLGIAEDGAMAEYALVPAVSLFRLPESASLAVAALAEPVSVALHAVNLSPCRSERKTVIIGAGTIGLLVLALLKAGGQREIAIVEPHSARAEAARAMGAALTVESVKGGTGRELGRFLGGTGAGTVFECAGTAEAIGIACSLAGPGSEVILLGICHQPLKVDFLSLVTREIRLIPSFSKRTAEFRQAIEIISAGTLNPAPIISRVIGLEAIETGLTETAGEIIKTLVAPGKMNPG